VKSKSLKSSVDAFFLVIAFLALPIAFVMIGFKGYGDNGNNYGMLRTWQEMVANGVYVPSRFQGNLPSELLLGYLAAAAGPVGANGLSLVLSGLSLILAYRLFREVEPDRLKVGLALAVVAINPFWVRASTTSMDYVHPIPFFLVGLLLLQKRMPTIAALCLAVAGGMRLSYAPLGLGVLLLALYVESEKHGRNLLVQSIVEYIVVVCLIYFPAFLSSHLKLTFLGSARPTEQGFLGLLARWAYKDIYLYGVLGTAVVGTIGALLVVRAINGEHRLSRAENTFERACLAFIVFHLLLFLYIPVRVEYLFPVLIAMAGIFLVRRVPSTLLIVLIIAEGSYWFFSIDLLQLQRVDHAPCEPIHGVGAQFKPHISQGVLVGELTGKTDELRCFPKGLLQSPQDIRDRLPVPSRF
jgi:hypothetical protein